MSDWGRGDVQRNWGDNGVEIVDELARLHGYERLLEPVRNESLTEYVQRCARKGLCHVAGNMQVLQDVQARKKAEARGLPVYDVDSIEPEFRGEHLRDLPPHERFDVYKVASITPVLPTPEWAKASQLHDRMDEAPPSSDAETETLDLSGLSPSDKFAAYVRTKNTLPGTVVPSADETFDDFEEE